MKVDYNGISIDQDDPSFLSDLGRRLLLEGDYQKTDETIPKALARPALNFCYGDFELAQRIYDYAHKNHFFYASPVLSNSVAGNWVLDPTKDGSNYWYKHVFIPTQAKSPSLPISCFAFDVPDNIVGQETLLVEASSLSVAGGGVGAHNSIRATTSKAPGPIPYEKVLDGVIGYFKQKGTRKGAIAYYMNVDHPDIREHIRFRVTGGDSRRRSDNRTQFHSAVNITDHFIDAVDKDLTIDLKCPHSGKVYDTVRARDIWEEILETRALTGEPYLLKVDLANRMMPATQKLQGLRISGSNLCVAGDTKITVLADGEDSEPIEVPIKEVINRKDLKVLSYNPKTDQSEFKPITNGALMNKRAKVLRLTCSESGNQLVCTPEHQVWTENRGYVMAKELKPTDVLRIL